jgi:hypothetical protein
MLFGKTTAAGHVKPAEVHDMLAKRVDFVLLDVRTKEEHMGANIPGSTLLPLDQLASGAEKTLGSKDKTIVVPRLPEFSANSDIMTCGTWAASWDGHSRLHAAVDSGCRRCLARQSQLPLFIGGRNLGSTAPWKGAVVFIAVIQVR